MKKIPDQRNYCN